jgi:Sigma 54 modulation/S30EA ribosomal protein C terminus
VVAEAPTEINRLSVGEAVMQMDLADQQLLMFRNSTTGELNVVYRRNDGNIGWIEPERTGNGQ